MSFWKMLLLSVVLLFPVTSSAWGRCDVPPGNRPDDKPPPVDTPEQPPLDPGGRVPPGTPPDAPRTPPTSPTSSGPTSGLSRPGTPAGPRRSGGVDMSGAWKIWWELSREHLLGLRGTLKGAEPTSGTAGIDPMLRYRLAARAGLRKLLTTATDPALRAVAVRALGRVGDDEDARFLFMLLQSKSQPTEVFEGAAIGLASLAEVRDPELRAEMREFFDQVLADRIRLPGRTRLLAILAFSLRARDDFALVRALGQKLAKDPGRATEATVILYGCGLTKDRMLSAELCAALESGKVAGKNLHDIARAHAAMGLALTSEPGAVDALAAALSSRKIGVHTRRAAAIAIGVLLRGGDLRGASMETARRAILGSFETDRDPLVQGYCLLAMGTADEPFGLPVLKKTLERSGNAVVRPFSAMGLGLAVARLPAHEVAATRSLLLRQFQKNRDPSMAGALSIALGLSGAPEAKELLVARVKDEHLNPSVRGPACEALGLLGAATPAVVDLLTKALAENTREVVEDAAIALGLIGRTDTARMLVVRMITTKSQIVREHMVVALSHLGGTAAISPLLAVVKDPTQEADVRESAAEALGVLLDPREIDPLFELDAACNPYGLTEATRELIRIY